MGVKTHIAFDVSNIERTIHFYRILLGAQVTIRNREAQTATLEYNHQEISIFERKEFNGYPANVLKSLHFGFELESFERIDLTYQAALENGFKIKTAPFWRSDGDYAFFLFDPDGFQIEILFGTHQTAKRLYGNR